MPNGKSNPNPLRWMVLLTVIIGTFLGRLDQVVVTLALPKIITEFSITVDQASWIATAYILANAVFVPIWGKLGDSIGRRKVYVMGFSIFIVGSVLAGLAWNLNSMLVFRVIQAIASSADYPTAMAIIAVTFPNGRDRAQALGIWSASFMSSVVFGPLISGPLIDNFGWRSVFLVNLPVGLLGLGMALLFIRESVGERKTLQFDLAGSITLGIFLSALVLVLDRGADWGWVSLNSAAAYLVMIVFGLIFYRIDRHHPEPIIDFRFFKIQAFDGALINNFVTSMGLTGALFLLPVFAETYLGYTATQAGYLFMPVAFAMMIGAPLGASLAGRVPARFVVSSSTILGGIGLLVFTRIDARSTAMEIMVPLSILAFGMGFGMSQRTTIVASAVPASEIGIASSVLALVRNVAGAFGVSVFATILSNATASSMAALGRYSTVNTNNPLVLLQAYALMVLKAQIDGYRMVFLVAGCLVLAAGVLALWTLNIRELNSGQIVMEDTVMMSE